MKPGRHERDAEFAEFVAGAYPALVRTARMLTGSQQNAEDLVQAALVRVYVRWHQMADWDAPRAYARKTMVNLYASWRRRRWHGEVPGAEPPSMASGEDLAEGVVERDRVNRILAGLPPAQRAVLVLRFCEDLSVEETAELLGCSTGTVKSRTNRALESLRTTTSLAALVEGSGR